MKKVLIFVFLAAVTSIYFSYQSNEPNSDLGFKPDSVKVIEATEHFSNEDRLINTLLSRYHYKKYRLTDSLSAEIFNRFLKSLDFGKMYLLKEDYDFFNKFKYSFDDFIQNGEISLPFTMFKIFRDRVNNRIDFAERLLKQNKFDFTKKEFYQIDRTEAESPKDTVESNELWRKRVKYDYLNLKLAGKDSSKIPEILIKRYENIRRAINQYNSEDVFQLFENSYSLSIDPHTNYLSPISSENFRINISLSLEGIGAQLQNEDEFTKIVSVIPGGPAFKSKLLKPNDKIVAVAQGDSGEYVDIIGWRVTDVVQLIRGKKGTKVRLQIIPVGKSINSVPVEVVLIRDKIKLEEQAARDSVLNIIEDNIPFKIGVITIPTFYSDFDRKQNGDKDYNSTSVDVKNILEKLKLEKVDGVIIDLRNNGGGSLDEAIKTTGLFIETGPVVQVKHSNGKIEVDEDPDPKIIYSGPLAVLINRYSASASEIFSAAIQDYKRGLIIGEQSYGKGTVQNLIDLNRVIPNQSEKFGQLKLTIAKFYRINGGSTQIKGVTPDIEFPSAVNSDEFGESSEPSALPWDEIPGTKHSFYSNLDKFLPKLIEKHNDRINKTPVFDNILEAIQEYNENKNKKFVSLNEFERRKEKEEFENTKFERENERRKAKGLKLLNKEDKNSSDANNDDPYLDESARILADYIILTTG